MNPFSASRPVKKSKPLSKRGDTPRLVLAVKDSKVQHILGISGAELTTARSQRRSSSSTTRIPTSSLSEATTIPVNYDLRVSDKTLSPQPVQELRLKASSILLGDEIEKRSTATGVSSSRLSRYPSSSTLHSHYDPATAPLSVSQQTSDSSSRDFALRKGVRSVITRTSQEMEHARQMMLFKSSKSSRKDSKKLLKLSTAGFEPNGSSPLAGNHSAYGVAAVGSRMAHSSAVSLPATPPPMTPVRKLFAGLKRSESQLLRVPPATPSIAHDPYAKINVRRPKPGAKNWFDGIDPESSDEDTHDEPELKQNFVSEVQRAFGGSETEVAHPAKHGSTADETEPSEASTPKFVTPSHAISETSVTKDNHSSHKALSRKVSFQHDKSLADHRSLGSKKSTTKLDAFVGIDLNKQSMLSLSSSDDEDEEEPKQQPAPLQPAPHIRESLAEGLAEDSEIEIGLAQAVSSKSGDPVARAVHSRANTTHKTHPTPAAIHVPPRASSRIASYLPDQTFENDASESDIITSFPATPSDTASFRTSIRSSILSDTGSLASTRPMMVTKQEEKLLAAMRRKKATMHHSSADTDRKAALRVLESGARNAAASNNRSRSQMSGQAGLDMRLSSRYARFSPHQHHHSLSDEEMDARSGYARESGTTFDTSVYSVRDSQATMRTMFSDDRSGTYSTYSSSEVTATSPTGRYSQMSHARGRGHHRRDTHFSMASNASSYRRDSHIVMLDGLDEALHRENIPSQLFMEAPFIGWEQAGLTAAH